MGVANADLPELPKEWRCTECGQSHEETALLTAPNPFDASDIISACPNCKNVGSFRLVCQVWGCEEEATCGRPRFRGFRYAHLCGTHFSEAEQNGT